MGRARARVAEHLPVVVLALVAVGVSVAVKHFVYPAYSFNRDEPVYLWQVQALAEGKVFTSGGGMPRAFQPWLSGVQDGMFFSQYTLGWPLVLLAFDVVLGAVAGAIAFGTALAVVGTYAFARELTRERTVAIVAAAVLVLSPLLVIQSGVYLGYLFSLGLGGLFGACFLAGIRRRSVLLLVAAGLCVGWLFMTRPFDGVLWGLAIVGYAGFAHRHELPRFARAVGWLALGVLPLLAATLAYNKHVTGSFTEFPITAADPRDTFGYGSRSIGEHWPAVDFTAIMGIKGSGRNGVELPPFLFGSYVAVAVAAAGLWLRRRDRTTLALVAIAAVFPIGYAFFWGIALSSSFAHVSGPIYFIPLLLPVCVLIATALTTAWRRSVGWTLALVVVMVAATVPFLVDRIDANRTVSESQEPWRDAASLVDDDALVIVSRSGPYLLHLNPFSENTPDLDGRILYATDRGPANLDVIAAHPDRTPYVESTDLTTEQTLTETDIPVAAVTLTPITVRRGPVLTVHATVENVSGDPVVVASLRVGGTTYPRVLSSTSSRGDTFETEWRIAAPAALGGTDTDTDVITVGASGRGARRLVGGAGSLKIDAGSGADANAALAGPHDRLRLDYRVTPTDALDELAVEVLEPGTPIRLQDVRGEVRPRHAAALDTLSVEVTEAATP